MSNDLKPCPFCGDIACLADRVTQTGDDLMPAMQYASHALRCRDCVLDRARKAEAELAAIRERDRWILVGERLPNNDRYVLLNLPREITQAYWHDGRKCWRSVMGLIDEPVTHWRELPAPPEAP